MHQEKLCKHCLTKECNCDSDASKNLQLKLFHKCNPVINAATRIIVQLHLVQYVVIPFAKFCLDFHYFVNKLINYSTYIDISI